MFRAAAVFSNNMVLQRDKKICVFGEGESGKRINADLYKEEKKISASALCMDGKVPDEGL